jgi:HEAT repeat protein
MLLSPHSHSYRNEFEIKVVKGDERTVEKPFEPFLKNIHSRELKLQTEAIETITAVAPPFLEKTLLAFAEGDDPFARDRAIPALGWLNTEESRRVLVKLIEDRQKGYSERAMDALAGTHDHTYVPLLEKLAKDPAWQRVAIPDLGELGGQSVIWFLAALIYYPLGPPSQPPLQQLAIRGLANTGSLEAIPYLIQALRTPLVQQDAANALAQLTHYAIFLKDGRHGLYAEEDSTAEQMAERWQRWWTSRDKRARVYDPDDCGSPPEALPER